MTEDLREMRAGLASRVRRWQSVAARATPGPLLVRTGVFATGLAAMVLAYPAQLLLSRYGLMLLALAMLPALAPGSFVVTPALLVAAGGWLITTAGFGEPVTLWRLVALAGCLYLVHTTAALAAHLPYDAIVSVTVLARWFGRAGLVVLATAVLAVYLLVMGELLRGPVTLLATLAGFAIAVTAAYALVRQLRRPD